MRVWKQRTDEHRTIKKTGSGRRKQADWHQVVFSDESRFNLWDHEGHIRFRRYAGECCQHPELWFRVRFRIMDVPICYELRVISIATAQHKQFLPWPAYSPDMSPTEHMRDLVGRRLARDTYPAASKDELLQRMQAIWNYLPQADIQNLTPCHVV
ncbi:transposable element Tcb2 transposase [Trichonephila clavipes]|nr:transposable element Tcb2 transposase [Trichonephila clavipes]